MFFGLREGENVVRWYKFSIMSTSKEHTPGEKIRELRKERALSIEALANEAGITAVALSNIETKQAHPQRNTLLKLIRCLENVLSLLPSIRRSLVYSYGYTDVYDAPTPPEITTAITAWELQFKNTSFPAYVIDMTMKIHTANRAMLGLMDESGQARTDLWVYDLIFSPPLKKGLRLEGTYQLTYNLVAYIWFDHQPYFRESWWQESLLKGRKKYPLFGELIDGFSSGTLPLPELETMEPVTFTLADGSKLTYGILSANVVEDPRFRSIQFIPMGHEKI